VHTRGERLARGWLVGAFATGVAAVSHTLAGGYRPDPLGLVVGVVFAGMLGTLAIGRRPSLPRLAIAVGGSQLAFHLLFSLLGSDNRTSPHVEDPTAMPGMHMDMGGPLAPVAVHDHLGHLVDPGMWLAHAVAGVLTIWFLRRAERAVWGMLRRLVVRLLVLVRPVPVARPAAVPLARPRALRPGRHVAALPLRGPPVLTSP